MGKIQGGSVQSVQIERDFGEIYKTTTQQTVHEAVWDEFQLQAILLIITGSNIQRHSEM